MNTNKLPICYFFVPGLGGQYRSGGLMVIKDVARMVGAAGYGVKFVATHEKCEGAVSPEEVFGGATGGSASSTGAGADAIYFVTWGPLVEKHINLIRKNAATSANGGAGRGAKNSRIIYYAQSFGWNIKVPTGVSIVCVSRFVMSQWALHAPENYCAYIPPVLAPCFNFGGQELGQRERDIDILVHTRKQNNYCLNHLLPALQKKSFAVEILNEWIPQERFAALLQRSKIFLYVTDLHKAGFRRRLPGEGFGLPALEALACGTLVGSNLFGGVTDFLTPGENCIKLQNGSTEFDVAQIEKAVAKFSSNEMATKEASDKVSAEYSPERVQKKWHNLLSNI